MFNQSVSLFDIVGQRQAAQDRRAFAARMQIKHTNAGGRHARRLQAVATAPSTAHMVADAERVNEDRPVLVA
jgi:hypothetical protein